MARLFQFYIVSYDDDKEYKEDGIVAAAGYADAMKKVVDWYGENCICTVEFCELEELTLLNDLRPHAQSGE